MLLVRNAIFMSVFLNRLVMYVVSLPTEVNVAHFCVRGCVRVIFVCVLVMSGGSFGVGWFSWWIGKALLYRMFWMAVTSVS